MSIVELVHWPADQPERLRLAKAGIPCLLLVEIDAAIPTTASPIEDWVWRSAPAAEVEARTASLALASEAYVSVPLLNEDFILHYRGARTSLPPVESRLVERLIANFGMVVSREDLSDAAWGAGAPGRNALDVHILRIRRRIEPVGLGLRTVRGRGYILDAL